MNVSLTPELEKVISKHVASGHYATASEVVREALRMLDREKTLVYIRSEVQKGVDDMKAGRFISLKTPADHAKFVRDIKEDGRKKLTKR